MNRGKEIARLHYITQDLEGISHAQLAKDACSAGIRWVQLRVKNKSFEEWLAIAKEVQAVCRQFHAKLIVNDHVEIAKIIGADGVHLGKEDMPPEEARKILGDSFIIGGSTNTLQDIERMNKSSVDYIGLGPFRFTTTREKLNPVLGLEKLTELAGFSKKPVIAIGGITPNDIDTILSSIIYGIAVSSAINLALDREQAAKKIMNRLNAFDKNIRNPIISPKG